MRKRLTLAALTLLCVLTGIRAQEVSAPLPQYDFHIDSTTIAIGDQTVLSVRKGPLYPTLDDLSNNDIVAVRQWTDSTDGTLYTALTSFEPGDHWLHIGNDSVLITVNDVANVDTTSTDIRDIAGILRQPYTFWEIFRWVLLGLVLIAVAVAAYFAIKRIKAHKPLIHIPQAPPLPADTKALQALEALRVRQLWQQGKVKEYHTELTDILRNYLEEAYHIQSTEMTSDQTLEAVEASAANVADSLPLLRQVLQTADMVKFAKSEPLPHEHDRSMSNAVNFVHLTAPHPAATEESADATPNPTNPS